MAALRHGRGVLVVALFTASIGFAVPRSFRGNAAKGAPSVARDFGSFSDFSGSNRHLWCVLPIGVTVAACRFSQRARSARPRLLLRATPFPDGKYDPDTAAAYFQSRPWMVTWRAAELAGTGLSLAARLLLDLQTGQWEANASKRAQELVEILTDLGPTFIKIGQALSIRADLLSPAYLKALTELQDRVPPFPTPIADEIIESELGRPVGEVFEEISPAPIASASLGQVYRAKIREGPEVAVKVQRPGMEEVVALDLYLLKLGSGPLRAFLELTRSGLNTDIPGLVDEWGKGFVGELDYLQEAANAVLFQHDIEKTPLAGAVFAPPPIESCSSAKVLTTEWVVGERLETSGAEDVTKLCSVAMNTYLTMMLETGVLHADPHPGNLLRTPDGRLCILDWGLVTTLDPSFRVAYIEHIAHLVSGDYDPVPTDLVTLGFVPEGMEDDIIQSQVVGTLANVYGQWSAGGGAARVDVNALFNQIQDLSRKYGNLFRVPPYFFYIARAFAVLEGIGLSNDEGYSVVGECLPYVAQRLISDEDPRISNALASFIYGSQKGLDRQPSPERLKYLATGFSSYMAATRNDNTSAAKEASKLADQLASLVLGRVPNGSETNGEASKGRRVAPALQDLLLDEIAKVVGANARRFASSWKLPGSGSLGLMTPDTSDEQVLANAQEIVSMAEPQVQEIIQRFRDLPFTEQRSIAAEVLSKLWDYRGQAFGASGRLAARLLLQGISRVRADIDKAFSDR
ncbi:unnamed protein product [Effrenium voratum]|uniref:Protein kinase domain-containing protein n=1 Tax=Effrenium voratum TaxID=2562239 RepID=A0AA36ITJ5_9DINO|nr:unnamed protein product [Effrenium voratum]